MTTPTDIEKPAAPPEQNSPTGGGCAGTAGSTICTCPEPQSFGHEPGCPTLKRVQAVEVDLICAARKLDELGATLKKLKNALLDGDVIPGEVIHMMQMQSGDLAYQCGVYNGKIILSNAVITESSPKKG